MKKSSKKSPKTYNSNISPGNFSKLRKESVKYNNIFYVTSFNNEKIWYFVNNYHSLYNSTKSKKLLEKVFKALQSDQNTPKVYSFFELFHNTCYISIRRNF